MEEEEKRDLLPDWVQQKVMMLRQQLEHGSVLPEAAVALLKSVLPSQTAAPFVLEPEDETMLSVILSDALAGVDIASRYPAYFRRIMAEPTLSAAFLDALDMLETSLEEVEAEQLPPATVALPFLKETKAAPQLRHTSEGRRQVIWRLFHDRLNREFFGPSDLVYRSSGRSLLEDESFILIEDSVQIDQLALNVMLEAIQPMTEPGWLRLQLNTAAQSDPLPPLEATITWGDFKATATPDRYGYATFPLLALETIVDPVEMLVVSDLQLVLELSPA